MFLSFQQYLILINILFVFFFTVSKRSKKEQGGKKSKIPKTSSRPKSDQTIMDTALDAKIIGNFDQNHCNK